MFISSILEGHEVFTSYINFFFNLKEITKNLWLTKFSLGKSLLTLATKARPFRPMMYWHSGKNLACSTMGSSPGNQFLNPPPQLKQRVQSSIPVYQRQETE